MTTWNYTCHNLDIACNKLSSIILSRYAGPLLGKGSLCFDSCKRPPPVSDHSVFAFWVVAYGRFDCSCKCTYDLVKIKNWSYNVYSGIKVRRPEGFHIIVTLLMALSFMIQWHLKQIKQQDKFNHNVHSFAF